jgi:hypothetical protein
MKLKHKTPCSECPWRKKACPGWLGGYSAEEYADTVGNNEAPACHNKDYGPDDDRTAFCVGALAVASNQCISLRKSAGADAAKKVIGMRDDCFAHVKFFFEHHSPGKKWRPLIERLIDEARGNGKD